MTGFDSKVLRDEPDCYRISFYTDSKEAYELVQSACRLCVDAQSKKRSNKAHWILTERRCYSCSYKCSNCGREIVFDSDVNVHDYVTRCTCGCYMTEVDK